MTGFKNPLHGRTHLTMGSDPIPGITIGGIKFDTNPQAGTWLYVETTGMDGDGYGMRFVSAGTFAVFSEASIVLDNAGSGFGLQVNGDDFLFTGVSAAADFVVNVGGSILLNSAYGGIASDVAATTIITLTTPIKLTAQGGANIEIWPLSGDTIIKSITPGSPGTAIPIFKVTHGTAGAAPTYHILTGATWAADL